jgi:hypothetical protein
MIISKGHEIPDFKPGGSSTRRAVQLQNAIVATLRRLEVHPDDIEIPLERVAIKRVPAVVSWYVGEDFMYFSRQGASFLENLYVISKVLSLEIDAVLEKREPMSDFISKFVEKEEIVELRKKARETLGVEPDCTDLAEIKKKYKEHAKAHHPDAGGSVESFKELSVAFKILTRELSQ